MRLTSFLSLLGISSATTVLLPLYIWPGPGSPTNWGPVFSALKAYPQVSFTIVINPDSGPGGDPSPNTDWVPAVAQLNAYKNAVVIGYVHTSYGASAPSELAANITKYAQWNKYASTAGNQNTSINGIFFDETEYRDTSKVSYMNTAAAQAKSALKRSGAPAPLVVYNPGTRELDDYFTSNVDLVVQSEVAFSDYNPSTTISSLAHIPKSAIIIHDAAGQASAVTADVKKAKGQGLGGIYFTADCCYNSDLSLIQAVAAGLV